MGPQAQILQHRLHPLRPGRNPSYDADAAMYRRANYSSGEDFVLEYGELRFTFNERDFRERCEQAARRLGFLCRRIEDHEAEDLINIGAYVAGSNPRVDLAIARNETIRSFTRQGIYEVSTLAEAQRAVTALG